MATRMRSWSVAPPRRCSCEDGSRDDFQRSNLVALKFEEESEVNQGAIRQWRTEVAAKYEFTSSPSANMLLANRPMKLAAIASAVGYESESSFGKVFGRVMGIAREVPREINRLNVVSEHRD